MLFCLASLAPQAIIAFGTIVLRRLGAHTPKGRTVLVRCTAQAGEEGKV
jgi:hypothetical protein